ncbi:hypothetical protein [Haliscomenobacter sp.]|uniref:hypothetical protein n=1 Tax=Haliscomenobacter sp. TaxID=2717303 RepID=UPI003364FC75
MKTLLLSIILFLPLVAVAQWRNIYRGNDEFNDLIDASFYTAAEGYVLSEKWVGATLDSGYTFQKSFIDVLKNIDYNGYRVSITAGFTPQAVHGIEKNKLLVLGGFYGEPAVLSSTDNGANWKVVYHRNLVLGGETFIATLDFEFPVSPTRGYALLSSGVIATNNGGASWNVLLDREERNFIALDFVDNLNAYLAEENSLQRTSNGGVNWTNLNNLPFKIKDISAISATSVFVLTPDNDIFYSQNSGATWVKSNRNSTRLELSNDIYFVNDNMGYLNASGFMYQTRNRGTSWELMPLIDPSGMGKIIPYDQNQLWACGGQEQLYLTTNAGGKSIAKAFFDFDLSDVCTKDTVRLSNQSQPDRQYLWYKNNVFFSSAPSPQYQPGANRMDELKLVVKDGLQRDSSIQIIDVSNYFSIKLESESLQDSVCSVDQPLFKVLNSQVGVSYFVDSDCCGGGTFFGNGTDLTVSASARLQLEGPKTYWVTAIVNNGCGNQRIQQTYEVVLISSIPGIEVINNDTVCIDKLFYIRVSNSRVGYEYWADASLPKVKGNGGIIELPCIAENVLKIPVVFTPPLLKLLEIRVFVRHANLLCADPSGVSLYVYQRRPDAQFKLLGAETLVGDTLTLDNQSIFGFKYYWEFSRGAHYEHNDTRVPIQLSFNRPGYRQVKLYTYSKEGCVDSIAHTLEVLGKLVETPLGTTCADEPDQHVDSLYSRKYRDNRTIYEDQYGSRILGGTFRSVDQPWRYLIRDQGWYALKYDRNGKLLWQLETPSYEIFPSSYAIEQAIGDAEQNTYLLGYCSATLAAPYAPGFGTLTPGPGAFIVKVSPEGKVLWVRYFYRGFNSGAAYPNFSRGSILLGKSNAVYFVTRRPRQSGNFYMDETQIVEAGDRDEGLVIQLNSSGQLLRHKSFPSHYQSFEQYAAYNAQEPDYQFNLPMNWPPVGNLVLFNVVNTSLESADFDNIPISFNTQKIGSALLILDTVNLQFKAIKPIYRPLENENIGLKPDAYTLDQNGNYYVSYTHLDYFHHLSPRLSLDTLKPKTYLSAFAANGNIKWVKKIEGLHLSHLVAGKDQLKMGGLNYFVQNGVSYTRFPNHSPLDAATKKLTFVSDTAVYWGKARLGKGSIDAVVGTLALNDGALIDLVAIGTKKMDATMTMAKGYGDQLWVSTTLGSSFDHMVKDTSSVLKTFKLPMDDDCGNVVKPRIPLSVIPLVAYSSRQIQYQEGIRVYPNPAQDWAWVECIQAEDRIKSIHLSDGLGRKIWTKVGLNERSILIDLQTLPTAQIYWLEVHTTGGLFQSKIVKL